MKTFKEFQKETQQLDEGIPLVVAGKVAGAGLSLYSAYSAAKNLAKGKYRQAGMDALGVVPGGKVFKTIKTLGGAKKLAKAGSATQSLLRHGTDNAFSRTLDKGYEKGFELGKKGFNYGKKLVNKLRKK
tara:strand:+ start:187 stop:573 length:387 start_codon:yes stop_codon:yes gene_type:complete